jgi:hypothetical protein
LSNFSHNGAGWAARLDLDHALGAADLTRIKMRGSGCLHCGGMGRPPLTACKERQMLQTAEAIAWFDDIGREEVARVGGKNASLGEMVRALAPEGIKVPPGFATTADAYWDYL